MGKFDGILLLSDFDRTITGSDGLVPKSNAEAIRYFEENGGLFSIASGRSAPLFRPKVEMCHINAPAVLNNGALGYDYTKEEVVFVSQLDDGIWAFAEDLQKRFPALHYEVQGIHGHAVYSADPERYAQFADHGVKLYEPPFEKVEDCFCMASVMGHFVQPTNAQISFRDFITENEQTFEQCNRFIEENSPYSPVRATHEILEYFNKGVNKGSGALRMKKALGADTLICVGDALNDIPMIHAADMGFMPADGDKNAFPLAGDKMRLCATSDEGAIADVIERIDRYGRR